MKPLPEPQFVSALNGNPKVLECAAVRRFLGSHHDRKRRIAPHSKPLARATLTRVQFIFPRHGLGSLCQVMAALVLFCSLAVAQDAQPAADKKKPEAGPTIAAAAEANASAKPEPSSPAAPTDGATTSTNQDGSTKAAPDKSSDEIQLSLQGANIDMVVQWLAQTTGKTVIKHPRVQCQLTITSSKKLTKREAITLVYRALSLEGFTATESSNAILITPEGQEPKMSPELVDATRKDIPEGRQRLVKIFPLQHMQATEMKEKLRGVLSDKGSIEIDERSNELVVTDYNENLKLMAELIHEFDVTDSDSAIQIFPLKYADAEEVGSLIGLILNVTAPGGAPAKSPSSSEGGGGPSPMPMPGPMGMPGGGSRSSGSGGGSPPSTGIGNAISAPQVRLWPDRTSNRLIVSAPKSKLAEVQRLLDILDTDQPEDVTVRSLPLKNVAATDLVRELEPIFQKMSGKSRKEAIQVGANDRSNSLIILSSETNFRAIEKLVVSLDTEDAQEKVVQTFLLKNADAQDVAKQLQDLGKDQDSNRYPYYYFFSSSGGNDKGRKKMSVVADRRRNSLVVQAPPAQMPSIEKMIHELDEPITDDSLAPKIYHLKYVSAVDIEDVLNELFLKKTQQRPYFYFYDEEPQTQTDRDVGRLYGKVRITSEPYSNTIIVTSNSKESLSAVEEVLKQLDVPSDAGESTLRIGLRFAKASTVANSINILFAKNGSPPLRQTPQQGQQVQQQQPQQQQNSSSSQAGFDLEQETKEEGYFPWLGGAPDNPRSNDGRSGVRQVSDLVGRVRAVADQRSNALLVSANVQYFPQVLKLIEELDAQTDQVLIEARLVEVSADFLDKLGVRWSPDGSQVFTADDYDNSFLGHANATYQKGFGGLSSVNTPPSSSANVLQSLTTLRSGVLDSTISMDFLVQFLRRTTDAKVLAEPQINIRDNETGRLFVGQQVPIPQYTQVSTIGSQNTSFIYKDVGVVLEVTPHINSSGDVELRIHTESSTVVPGQTVLGGSVFDTRNFRTDLTAKNGQTLVLGGIIQKQVSDTLRKTPILGDIPGLGWAFKKKDKSSHEVELMVFMRPKVSRNAEQDKELLEDIYRKAPTVKQWDEEGQKRPEPKKSGATK
ncbi:MAG TPA: secretin N-terminal domain-containing protein [Verrucomicrobiae bacterium]|nr:secretin N-terminal domain-containing protein [Verrucomicrobiae bacterium]